MSDKRQKNQLMLAFTEEGRSEAPKASQEGTESRTAKCETERPAGCSMALRNPLNRPMRTRMSGGVAGVSGRPLPLCLFSAEVVLVGPANERGAGSETSANRREQHQITLFQLRFLKRGLHS